MAGARLRAAEAGKGTVFPSDQRRYPDPATEFQVYRLTDPAYTSFFPAYYNRAVSRSGFLLFGCDRTGGFQAFRLDVKTGETRQLTEAQNLDPSSLTLMPDEHGFLFVDGSSVRRSLLANLREREIYHVPSGFMPGEGFAAAEDGLNAFLVERQGGGSRLRMIGIARAGANTVTEAGEVISHPIPRPRRSGILYRRGGSLWLVNYDGKQNRRLRTEPGTIGPAVWAADGRTFFYIHVPEDRTKLNCIREHTPDTNTDKLVSPTSQFVHFGRNRDASVFVGASANKASPHLLLLLRMTRRELTLCEHKASDPASVAPIFSPSSQRIYFQSDHHGKPALYSMIVDRLVERTET